MDATAEWEGKETLWTTLTGTVPAMFICVSAVIMFCLPPCCVFEAAEVNDGLFLAEADVGFAQGMGADRGRTGGAATPRFMKCAFVPARFVKCNFASPVKSD